MQSKNSLSNRMRGKRGVSPIIATILLVAITVVLAAVLYILVTGIIGGSSSKPLQIGFGASGSGPNGAGTINYDNFTMSASSGLTTGAFGLKITTPSGTAVTVAAVPGGCTAGALIGACTFVAGDWYAVITTSTGTVVGAFGSSGAWSGTATAISSSQTLVLITPAGGSGLTLAGSGDTLAAFGTGSSQVSGQTTL